MKIGSLGAAAIVDGADAVQHERPGDADRQRRRGDGGADNRGDPGRGLRPGDHEPAVYSERNREGAYADTVNAAFAAFDK